MDWACACIPPSSVKPQRANDLAIFITMIATSLSSGLLFTLQGWALMNKLAVPFLLAAAAAMLWLAYLRRNVQTVT